MSEYSSSGFSTAAIRQQAERSGHHEHSVPLYLTSSFVFDSAESMAATFQGEGEQPIYSRYNNPNVDELIQKVATMEGLETGFATASGMAAVFSSLAALLQSGDHLIATRALFGSTHQLLTQILPRWGVSCTYVDPNDTANWSQAVQKNTRLFLVETPSNPGLALVDLEVAGRFCRENQLLFLVDNCFATPYLQQPAKYGADLVIHSATKWMDGQGRVLGGLILANEELLAPIRFFCRHTGPAMSPFNAWVLSRSLETLHLRMEAHCAAALELAQWLETRPEVSSVRYPFLESHPQQTLARRQMRLGGGLLCFELAAGAAAAARFLNRLQVCSRSSNLGDTRTILTHPTTTTHAKLSEAERQQVGITPGLLRMSVGLETVADIKSDLKQALG
ncbi:MAG: PLP-dependent transferase [Bacteroidota bacterium]